MKEVQPGERMKMWDEDTHVHIHPELRTTSVNSGLPCWTALLERPSLCQGEVHQLISFTHRLECRPLKPDKLNPHLFTHENYLKSEGGHLLSHHLAMGRWTQYQLLWSSVSRL